MERTRFTDDRTEDNVSFIHKEAIAAMRRFFAGRNKPCKGNKQGVPLKESDYLTPLFVSIAAEYDDFHDAAKKLNECIENHIGKGRQLAFHPLITNEDHVKFNKWLLLKEMKRCDIPKQFQGGIALLYCCLCEGLIIEEESEA